VFVQHLGSVAKWAREALEERYWAPKEYELFKGLHQKFSDNPAYIVSKDEAAQLHAMLKLGRKAA
jgi:hypothetical protein